MRNMPLEVFSATKPPVPRRGLWTTLLLLITTAILAIRLTVNRANAPLGPRIEVPGLGFSFQPPKEFTSTERGFTALGSVFRFKQATGPRSSAELVLHYVPLEAAPADVCRLILDWHAERGWLRLAGPQPSTPVSLPLGTLDGVEIRDPSLSTVVRAANVEPGLAIALSLTTFGAPPDDELYGRFDLSCRSMVFAPGSAAHLLNPARQPQYRGVLDR